HSHPRAHRPCRRYHVGGRQPQFPERADPHRAGGSGVLDRRQGLGTPPEGSALAAKKNLLPNRDRLVFYKDGQEGIPGVQAMHTRGQRVGHTCFVINSGAKSLFVVGDLTRHVILVEKPRMEVAFDTDPKQGVETRIKVMDMLASQRMPALVYHLPWPGIGHFAKRTAFTTSRRRCSWSYRKASAHRPVGTVADTIVSCPRRRCRRGRSRRLTGILLAGKCVNKLREEGMFAAIRGIALHGAVALCLAIGPFSAPARAQTLDELYTKANVEKSLVMYAGGTVSNYEPLAREFESKFPGLTVSIEGGFSNVLNQKIERQFSDQRLEADMALFQTAQDFVRWKGQGKMLAFKPEGFDAVDKSFKDPDAPFIVWSVGTLSYAYNTQQVKAENDPKSALDFLKGEFRGKMIACYPHDDDATLYLFHTLAKKYGSDYIDKYLANGPNWVQGHLSVSRSVAAGTNVVTLDA